VREEGLVNILGSGKNRKERNRWRMDGTRRNEVNNFK
jgi:hypothetical protein